MFEAIRAMPVVDRLEYTGALRHGEDPIPNCTLSLEYESFAPVPIKGLLGIPDAKGASGLIGDRLRLEAFPGTTVEVVGISSAVLGSDIVRFTADEFRTGALDLEVGHGRVIDLRASLAGMRGLKISMELMGAGSSPSTDLTWTTDGVTFSYRDEEYGGGYDAAVGTHLGRWRAVVPTIHVRCTPKPPVMLTILVDRIAMECSLACTLFSLATRRRVEWYSLQTWPGKLIALRRALDTDSADTHDPSDDLLDHSALVEGGFGSLVAALQRDGGSMGAIGRAIWFIGESRRPIPAASQFLLAYIAFETLVFWFVGKDKGALRVGQRDVDTLRDVLRERIEAVENEVLRSTALQNLSSIHRRTFADELDAVVLAAGVRTQDLWPKKGLREGHSRARKMRNGLVHQGANVDGAALAGDTIRIRSLAERLVLAALEWPPDKVARFCDSELEFINMAAETP